jgi:uncharacterized protein (DUF736 family)
MMKNIGVLWTKKSEKGTYLSGVLNDLRGDIRIAVFKNDKKEKENQPDYRIVVIIDEEKKEPKQSYYPNEDIDQSKMPF